MSVDVRCLKKLWLVSVKILWCGFVTRFVIDPSVWDCHLCTVSLLLYRYTSS